MRRDDDVDDHVQSGNTPSFGLCDSCIHATLIQSAKGSTFTRCDLSFTDQRFPKYPPVPVLQCGGHRERPQER
jgi:hypothetical protein